MTAPVLLHIKVSQDNSKGPIAMESVFDGLGELFRHTKTTIAFEIVIREGFLYFFVVCQRSDIDLIRGQLYSQYPHLELAEVADYSGAFAVSSTVATVKLERPDAYPIKTYRNLETDFLTNLSGLATSVGKNELLAMQIIIQPTDTEAVAYKLKEMVRSSWRVLQTV